MKNQWKSVQINGDKQSILVHGKPEKPILLFLAGGPGLMQSHASPQIFKNLEEEFLVIDYDQRASGKSFTFKHIKSDLHMEQYVEDVKELIVYLLKTYEKEKVYLVGHSFGSIIGILTAKKYPELLHAYIGVAQVVSLHAGNLWAYQSLLDQENEKTKKELEEIGLPPFTKGKKAKAFRAIIEEKGLGFFYKQPLHAYRHILKDLLFSKIYTFTEKIRYVGGFYTTMAKLESDIYDFNLTKEDLTFHIPLFFYSGQHDHITPEALIETSLFFAPIVEKTIVENTAHFPHVEKNEEFILYCVAIKEKVAKNVKN